MRWRFASTLAAQNSPANTSVDLTPFKALGNTAENVLKVTNSQIFGGEIAPTLNAQLLAYLKAGTFNDGRIREGLALAISAQQFQWY